MLLHLGVDNLSVVRHVGRLFDGVRNPCLAELIKDGDLILLIERTPDLRGSDTVRVTKVKGHADEDMVQAGRVRKFDSNGNDAADEAADFGRRTVNFAVVDARRNLSGICGRWHPVVMSFRFFIAISRAVVNHVDGDGTDPDLLVWSAGALPKGRRLVLAAAEDVGGWPHSVGILVNWVAFLGTLRWSADMADPAVGGVSFVGMLVLSDLWAGERLVLEKASPRYRRFARSISVSAVPLGPGIDIWRSCRFIGALMRSLCTLPGGIGKFVALHTWGQSLETSAHWVGEELPWPHF